MSEERVSQKANKRMAGSRERLLYDRHLDFDYEYERRRRHEISRFEAQRAEPNCIRTERFEIERPKRKNGYVFEDIYSDFDEAQGRLSLFRPIRPEYLNLQTSYVTKYNSLPRNHYYDNDRRRYKKDYYDFRIEAERRRPRQSYEYKQKERTDTKRNEIRLTDRNERRPISSNSRITYPTQKPKNVAVCKPLRLSEKNVKYWTTDPPEKHQENHANQTNQAKKPKKDEAKKIVKFSEVSGCRKMVIDDPICGRKVVAVRELEVSLDQMIQNGYFEKHNIPISLPEKREEIKASVPNGKCLSGTGGETPAPRKSRHLPQVIAALAVSLAPFSAGLGKGYSSPAIASLQGPGNATRRDFQLTDQQASWLASLSFLGALFGGMAGGAAMRHGRRRVLSLAAAPCSLSWLLTVLATSVRMMCITAFLGGFCCSILTMLSQVYISEISVPDIRGCLSAVLKIVGHLGVLFSFTIGAYLDWQQLALCISAAPLLLFCTVLYIPETPSYLVLIGKDEEAYKSLLWLRGPNSDVAQELATIRTNVLASKNFSQRQSQMSSSQLINSFDVRTANRLLGPILVTCGLMMFQRFSGAHAFSFYAVPIFRKTFGGMNPHGAAIAVSFVQLLASCLSGLLIDTVGRLPLLIVSSVLMSMALAGFGSYAYYEEVHRNQRIQNVMFHQTVGQNDWIPLLCVLVFTIAFSLGMSPISWLLIGELFPLEYRAFGSAMATAFSYLCAFVGVKTFVDFQQALGLHGAFWLYASISVGGLCFVVCCVPETKGRDLDEMDPNYVQSLSPKR
ncbi:facilitated trehalose transporter Tret1-like isoform X1 [Maniola jurtina]|uniref:facilitated trehalose transporter Tret1-like isoform X1 n=2 Tax=Maniola jurtina TaxID=191418 RepID=UPI001E689D1F|nr:facilitated trehalose transporter Tret1-like isoform X1 [Maniola jurtina]